MLVKCFRLKIAHLLGKTLVFFSLRLADRALMILKWLPRSRARIRLKHLNRFRQIENHREERNRTNSTFECLAHDKNPPELDDQNLIAFGYS